MKKIFSALLSIFFIATTQAATINIIDDSPKILSQHFRDVSAKAKLNIAIDSAVSRGILDEGSFFRPENEVPAIMFFDTLLRDSEIETKSSKFSDILIEAVEQKLISEEVSTNLQFNTPMTKFKTIESLIKIKKILPARRISQKFREIYPFINLSNSEDLPYIEAAVASGILSEGELKYFQPNELVTRREFISWIYNYFDHGTRQSKMEVDEVFQKNQPSFRYNSGLKSRFSIDKRNAQLQEIREKQESAKKLETSKSSNLSLKILDKKDLEKISSTKNPFPGKDILDEIYNEIITKYRFTDELTEEKKQEMVDQSLASMVQELGDKYSNYIKPSKSDEYLDHLAGQFEGIGAYIEMIDNRFTIIAPITGSPAEKVGLQPRDIVTKVEETLVEGMSVNEIVKLIMGPAGTTVNLEISRDSKILNFSVVRDRIVEPAVTLKWEKSVPIIGLHQFNDDTLRLMNEIIEEISDNKIRGVVLDLRNNPGGYTQSAIDVASLFLKQDDVVFYMEDRVKNTPFSVKKEGYFSDLENIVVIQNGGSASASELLTGALQDNKNIKIIGETSLGKGTVQTVRNLKNGGLLKLTIAKWLTPDKRWIHEEGISVDIEVSNTTSDERNKGIDRQLDAAVQEILNN